MKNVFIDANIWLSLYHFTNNDLEQFKKLNDLIGSEVNLILPKQVVDEVFRNRENKIKDSLDKFQKFDLQFPAFIKNYSHFEQFQNDFKDLKNRHKSWVNEIKDDIQSISTPADSVINSLFSSAGIIGHKQEHITRATARVHIGNPPGKNNSYGDAINWEFLLDICPQNENLFFISEDKDYRSIFNDTIFSNFLNHEWQNKKSSKIIFFNSLTDFLKEHIKKIELNHEKEKDELIAGLHDSLNFSITHSLISRLSKYSEWNPRQKEELCSIAINNSQVRWILGDRDVNEFYSELLNNVETEDEFILKVKEKLERLKNENCDDSATL